MKVRLTTLLLSFLFLWGSLTAYGKQSHADSSHQLKATKENVNVAITPALTFTEQEITEFPLPSVVNFACPKMRIGQTNILRHFQFTHKSVKAYIVFRVLRN